MTSLPDDDDAVWRALAHATRRRILDLLVESPASTGELVAGLGLDRHVVMAHLDVLRSAGLVTSEKRGRVRMNFLNAVPIQEITHRWVSPVSGPWASAVIAVRDRVERAATDEQADRSRHNWRISG